MRLYIERKRTHQSGSALIIILVIVGVLAVLGGLGYVLWSNFLKPAETSVTGTFCADGEDEAATNGVFCSEDLGMKLTVPEIFKGKVAPAENYEVSEGTIDPETTTSAGTSERVFKAEISGTDNFTFKIAREPLRTGYVDVSARLSGAYFDQATGVLSNVDSPMMNYDSATGKTTTTGSYAISDDVDSFMAGDVRVYEGLFGDAGVSIITYFAVINDKIVKISLHHGGYIGAPEDDPSTIDAEPVFDQLEAAVKAMNTN
jgi:hypothetical protein